LRTLDLTAAFVMSTYTRPSSSIITKKTCFGIWISVVDDGGSRITGSGARKLEVKMKNVTKRNAKSTIGVISNDGADLGIFTLGILFFY
jgi:hypothetical protein